jgi:aminoglycoside phosphotransferase (APT) family kinase protein
MVKSAAQINIPSVPRRVGATIRRFVVGQDAQRTARALPRDVSLRVHLTMLNWFLTRELPKKFPERFTEQTLIESVKDQGWSNFAFIARCNSQAYLIRMRGCDHTADGDNDGWAPYHKEEWILSQLSSNVPAPKTIGNGIGYVATQDELKRYAYVLQEYIEGISAESIKDELSDTDFRRELGVLARRIHQIPCKGFGANFDRQKQQFTFESWADYVEAEIQGIPRAALIGAGVVSEREYRTIAMRIERLKMLPVSPRLYHADFVENWSNILISERHQIAAVIDWELAGSGPAFQMEAAALLYMMIRDGRSKSERRRLFSAYLEGYGCSHAEYAERYAYDVETLILLQALKKSARYLTINSQGGLSEHAWRMRFFERAKGLLRLGGRLSEIHDTRILFAL